MAQLSAASGRLKMMRKLSASTLMRMPSCAATIGNSKLICYGGYGFTMDATGVTDMKVDGVSVGAEAPVWNINLGYHRLEVIGAAPPTITEFQHVA